MGAGFGEVPADKKTFHNETPRDRLCRGWMTCPKFWMAACSPGVQPWHCERNLQSRNGPNKRHGNVRRTMWFHDTPLGSPGDKKVKPHPSCLEGSQFWSILWCPKALWSGAPSLVIWSSNFSILQSFFTTQLIFCIWYQCENLVAHAWTYPPEQQWHGNVLLSCARTTWKIRISWKNWLVVVMWSWPIFFHWHGPGGVFALPPREVASPYHRASNSWILFTGWSAWRASLKGENLAFGRRPLARNVAGPYVMRNWTCSMPATGFLNPLQRPQLAVVFPVTWRCLVSDCNGVALNYLFFLGVLVETSRCCSKMMHFWDIPVFRNKDIFFPPRTPTICALMCWMPFEVCGRKFWCSNAGVAWQSWACLFLTCLRRHAVFCWTSRTCPSKVGLRIRQQPDVLVVRVGANLIRNADKHRENDVVQSHAFSMHEQPACVLANGWPVEALFPAQLRFGDLFKTAWWNIAAYCGESAKNSFLRQAA